MKRGWIVALAVLVACSLAPSAMADDGPMYVVGSGGAVRPMNNTDIRMAAETVQAVCFSRFAEYKIDFRFENSSPTTQSVLLGFPFDAPYYQPPFQPEDRYVAPAGFHAWENGRPLAVKLVHAEQDDGEHVDYYTHRAVFPPGETTVSVGYLIAAHIEDYDQSPGQAHDEYFDATGGSVTAPASYQREFVNHGRYDYTLHTGSYWRGNIGTAVLRWTLSPDFIGWGSVEANRLAAADATADAEYEDGTYDPVELLAGRIRAAVTTPSAGVYEWVFQDFKPVYDEDEGMSAYDFGFEFFTPPMSSFKHAANRYILPSARASSSLSVEDYAYPAKNVVDGDPSTAWAEGAKGPGIGQWIDISFPQTRRLRELRILPGYAKRPELFSKYARPRRLRFEYSDGTWSTVTLADSPSLQRFAVSATAKRVRVTILDVYRGSTRNETYISEIDFGQAAAPGFEDPGTLLAAARGVPSADATPVALAAGATPTVSKTHLKKPSPSSPAQAPSSQSWALLGATLVGVAIGVWKMLPD